MIDRLYYETAVGKVALSGYLEKVSAISSLIDTVSSRDSTAGDKAVAVMIVLGEFSK